VEDKMGDNNNDIYGNQILYDMCKQCPTHTDKDKFASKMWLIGRTYAASPERHQGKIGNKELSKQQKENLKRELAKLAEDKKSDSDFLWKIAGLSNGWQTTR
jgi:threonyl-tRNA synthetase